MLHQSLEWGQWPGPIYSHIRECECSSTNRSTRGQGHWSRDSVISGIIWSSAESCHRHIVSVWIVIHWGHISFLNSVTKSNWSFFFFWKSSKSHLKCFIFSSLLYNSNMNDQHCLHIYEHPQCLSYWWATSITDTCHNLSWHQYGLYINCWTDHNFFFQKI